MTRPVYPELEFRRARMREMMSNPSSQPSILSSDKPHGYPAKDGLLRSRKTFIGRYHQRIRNIYERLLWTAFKRVERRHYFDCHVGQDSREVICVDGDGFRLVAGRHRVFLLIGGRQHSFFVAEESRDAPTLPNIGKQYSAFYNANLNSNYGVGYANLDYSRWLRQLSNPTEAT